MPSDSVRHAYPTEALDKSTRRSWLAPRRAQEWLPESTRPG